MSASPSYDIGIIGAGPAGSFHAFIVRDFGEETKVFILE
jgi:flavin-dependent dehydrogenase